MRSSSHWPAGARVIGTASENRHASLRELGAEPVAYGPGLLGWIQELAPDGVEVAVGAVGGDEALDASLALVTGRDRILTLLAALRAFEAGIKAIGDAPGADPGAEIRAQVARARPARRAGQAPRRCRRHLLARRRGHPHKALAGRHMPGEIILIP
jgi:hypothetical protein